MSQLLTVHARSLSRIWVQGRRHVYGALTKRRFQHRKSVVLVWQVHVFTPLKALGYPFLLRKPVESALYWVHFTDGKSEFGPARTQLLQFCLESNQEFLTSCSMAPQRTLRGFDPRRLVNRLTGWGGGVGRGTGIGRGGGVGRGGAVGRDEGCRQGWKKLPLWTPLPSGFQLRLQVVSLPLSLEPL